MNCDATADSEKVEFVAGLFNAALAAVSECFNEDETVAVGVGIAYEDKQDLPV